MQWSAEPNAGFSSGTPWLPLGDLAVNVAVQADDPSSLLSLYRRLIWLRKRTPALRVGSYASLPEMPADVFAFVRAAGSQRALTAINFAREPATLELPAEFSGAAIACSSEMRRQGEQVTGSVLNLEPYEGCVLVT